MATNFERVVEFNTAAGVVTARNAQSTESGLDALSHSCTLGAALIYEECQELLTAITRRDSSAIVDAIGDILYVTYGFGHRLGVDVDAVFAEIHRSNMTKFCTSEDEARATVTWYRTNENESKRYPNVDYVRRSENCWVVTDTETGKVLKSVLYSPPHLQHPEQPHPTDSPDLD